MNEQNELVRSLYQRVALALSFIVGPKVDDWNMAQLQALKDKVNRTQQPLQCTNKALWTEFEADFQNAFTDTAKEQDAYNKLMALRMQGNDMDSYITSFNNLVEHSGWSLTDRGALENFKHGLPQCIALHIMYHDTPPTTLVNWQVMVRAEIIRQAQILADLGPDPRLTQQQGKGRFQPQKRPTQYPPPRGPPPFRSNRPAQPGPIPMDVDAA